MSLYKYILFYGFAVGGVLCFLLYLYFTRNFKYWKNRGVPYIEPIPFVGNLKDVVLMKKNFGLVAKDIYEKYKNKPFIGLFAFDEPLLQIHDLEIIKSVFVKDFQCFTDRSFEIDEIVDPLGAKGLFGLKGDRWRNARNSLTPSFTSGKMKKMYGIILECGRELVECLKRDVPQGQEVPVYEFAARYTTDIIAACAFGIEGNNLKDPQSKFRNVLRRHFEFSTWEAIIAAAAFLAPKLVKQFKLKILKPDVEDFVRTTFSENMEYRQKHNIKRNDLFGSLMELRNEGRIHDENDTNTSTVKYFVDDEDVLAHSFNFMLAGFETSATTMSYTLYELALHTDVQEKLRKEVFDTLAEVSDFTYDILLGMPYLDMVLSETLRRYPPVPFLDRRCVKPYTIPGTQLTLEEGSKVSVPLYAIHMDEEFFPNPKHFDPERFSDKNKHNINKYAYMPFGNGPRNCVGLRFALLQAKCGIAHILKEYKVLPHSSTPTEVEFNPQTFLLQPKHNITLLFEKL